MSKSERSAFPVALALGRERFDEYRSLYLKTILTEGGMTLREYFASTAGEPPADFLRIRQGGREEGPFETGLEWRVRWSWAYADAMLEACQSQEAQKKGDEG